MIPPALLEVIEYIPQTVFNELERKRSKEDELEVTTDQSFKKPSQKVGQSEKIKTRMIESIVIYLTVLSVAYLFIIHKRQ